NRCGRIGKDSLVVRLKLIFHRILFFVNKKPDLWAGLYTIAFVDSLFYQCQKTSNPTCYPQATTKIDMLCVFSLQRKFIIFFVVCKKNKKNKHYKIQILQYSYTRKASYHHRVL